MAVSLATVVADEVESSNLYPLREGAQLHWVESDENVVHSFSRGGIVDAGGHTPPAETIVQHTDGGVYDAASYYWSNGEQGLLLHKIYYPSIESASLGAASIEMEFVPPVQIMPSSSEPYTEVISSQGYVRYEISFEPVDHALISHFSQNNHSATSITTGWRYHLNSQLLANEVLEHAESTLDNESLCTTRAVWELIISGRIIGQGDITVTLAVSNWLADGVGAVKQQDLVKIAIGEDTLLREVTRTLQQGSDPEGQEIQLPLMIETNEVEEAQKIMQRGWNLVQLAEEGSIIGGCSNADWMARNVDQEGMAWDIEDFLLSTERQEIVSHGVENVAAVTESGGRYEAVWLKMLEAGVIYQPAHEGRAVDYEGLQSGWNLLPLSSFSLLSELEQLLAENGWMLMRWLAFSPQLLWIGGRGGEAEVSLENYEAIWVYLG